MSDDEYYSDNNSDKSDSDVEEVSNKKPLFNIAIKKLSSTNTFDDSEPDDADSEESDKEDDDLEDDDIADVDVEQMGGIGDDDDDEVLEDATDDDEDKDIELD
jgi:hypothetical protein